MSVRQGNKVIAGGNSITVDQALDINSPNPIANSAVTAGLNGKEPTIAGAATTITGSDLTASMAVISNASGKIDVSSTTSTELGYVHGVTSNIQTQLNNKADKATTLTGYGITDGANTDLSNLTATGANIGNWSSNVTNCITEIPQDIKLELNNGTLTLKAGSKVYVPNGSGIFNEETIDVDRSRVISESDGQYMVFYSVSYGGSRLVYIKLSDAVSGSSDTSVSNTHVWYDTTNNQIKFYNSGSYIYTDLSLPITLVTISNSAISSIDQVFNGLGYIGSTIFALPGVKGLAPNGRNADGSLKNLEVTVNNVLTHTGGLNTNPQWVTLYSSISSWDTVNWIGYNSQENILFNKEGSSSATSGPQITACVCAFLSAAGNQKITSFTPKTAFHAVDYSDLNQYVDTHSNQTIGGYKYFSNQIRRDAAFGSGGTSLIEATDTNGKGMIVNQAFYANNAIVNRMAAYNATTQNWTWIDVWNYDNGGTYATAPASDGWGTILLTSAISKSQNGYVKLGNGIIIQWGLTPNITAQGQEVTLPTAFSTTNYSVTATMNYNGGSNHCSCYDKTTTSFKMRVGAGGYSYWYIAIGY